MLWTVPYIFVLLQEAGLFAPRAIHRLWKDTMDTEKFYSTWAISRNFPMEPCCYKPGGQLTASAKLSHDRTYSNLEIRGVCQWLEGSGTLTKDAHTVMNSLERYFTCVFLFTSAGCIIAGFIPLQPVPKTINGAKSLPVIIFHTVGPQFNRLIMGMASTLLESTYLCTINTSMKKVL